MVYNYLVKNDVSSHQRSIFSKGRLVIQKAAKKIAYYPQHCYFSERKMEPLKEMFNQAFYQHLSIELAKVYNDFDRLSFYRRALLDNDDLSLNQRMRNTSVLLRDFLPLDFPTAADILKKVIPHTKKGYTNLLFPDFIGLYGHEHFEISMESLKYFTSFGSSEFAIREFLKRDFSRTIQYMIKWSKNKDPHVRRLSSEGSRPRLPWSFKLDEVIRDPSLTKPILENLKTDPELYVRKSVANHLNDISKENPDYMLALVKGWDQSDPRTAWIIKHASRTLIKKGDSASLSVFNYEKNPKLRIDKFKLHTPKLQLGEKLHFDFDLVSEKNREQKLVVDYLIHYRKKAGSLSPKVFKLKNVSLKPNEKVTITAKQLFRNFTTRTHFKGRHVLEIQINGKIMHSRPFHLSI
jgi:3-methyladenine DNA glycosylase AlkC